MNNCISRVSLYVCRTFSTSKFRNENFKVAIAGARGLTGQTLSLLLKRSSKINELCLYDLLRTDKIAEDLSCVDTPTRVRGFNGFCAIKDALIDSNIVIISSSCSDKDEMSKDDMFEVNAPMVRDMANTCAEVCPNALITVICNPVNALVPIVARILERAGKFDPKKLFGMTTLDNIRANSIIANLNNLNPMDVHMPVIGGQSGRSLVPILSQAMPSLELSLDQLKQITSKLQDDSNASGGSMSRLATAYAAARFVDALLLGLQGTPNVLEYAYVRSDVTNSEFFSTPLIFGKSGVEKNLGLGPLTDYERELVDVAVEDLQKSIVKATEFINGS